MTTRERIKNNILSIDETAWKSSVYVKLVFRIATKLSNYANILPLLAFLDAYSILYVSFVDKFIHYFDINRRFDL